MFRPSDSCKGQLPQHRMKPNLRHSDNNRHTNSLGEISGASGQSLRATATEEGRAQGPPPQLDSLAR